MSFGMHIYWRRSAVRKMGVFPGAKVLDGCTGTADFAQASAKRVGPSGLVVGFDFSANMLKHAKPKTARQNSEGRILLGQADATKIPFQSGVFDFVTVGCGIRNLNSIEQGFQEIYRVLKKGGKFACLDLGRPYIPIYDKLYYFYFFQIVPIMGDLIAHKPEEYSYLPHSLHTFPDQEKLKEMLLEAGFDRVEYENLVGGAMALHIAEKH